jgi:16S rRNA (guanine(1405)-N(7))-methyltransferase
MQVAQVVDAVSASAKYRQIDPHLIAQVGRAELAKGRSLKEAIKATKNKLHQIAGAYFPDKPAYGGWAAQLAQADDGAARQSLAHTIMGQHASTRERLPFLADFYTTLWAGLPPIGTLLDLACGLNPLAVGHMPLAPTARYLACDIYQDQIDFLNRWFELGGQAGAAFVANLLDDTPLPAADLVLLLKTIPCLEQVDKGIGPRLLARITAPVVILSYPARSLGGQTKGMVENYAHHFAHLTAGQPWQITRFDFPTEIVFRLQR